MAASNDTADRVITALAAVLPAAARVRRAARSAPGRLTVNGEPVSVAWLGEGRLPDVQATAEAARDRPDIVVARRLTPGARAVLSEAGVGWVDETGAAEIATGSIVVSRDGSPSPAASRPARWTPGVLAVAEAALCGTAPTTAVIQAATGLSTGTCVNALRALTELGLLEADAARGRDSGRRLADPDRLLSAYADAAPPLAPTAVLDVGVTWRDPAEGVRAVAKKWATAGIAYALSGSLAADHLAPYLTSVQTAELYVAADGRPGLEVAARAAGLRPVPGGRLTLRPFPTVAVDRLAANVDGLRLAPWPRVYVDLLASGVRGEDAAEHLREVIRGR